MKIRRLPSDYDRETTLRYVRLAREFIYRGEGRVTLKETPDGALIQFEIEIKNPAEDRVLQ